MGAADLTAADRLLDVLQDVMRERRLSVLPVRLADRRPADDEVDRAAPAIWVDAYDLMSATIRRTPHISEGSEAEALHLAVTGVKRADLMNSIRIWTDTLASLLEQDAEITACGGDPIRPGARWTTCHPVLAAAVRLWGWNADDVASPSPLPAGMILAGSRYDNALYAEPMQARLPGGSVTLTRRLLRRRVSVDSLMVTPGGGSAPGRARLLFTEQEGVPLLSAGPASLPETVMDTLPGRHVGDVINIVGIEPFRNARIIRGWGTAVGGESHVTLEIGKGDVLVG